MNLMILVARGEIFRLFTNKLWGIIKSLGHIQLPLAEKLSICLTAFIVKSTSSNQLEYYALY